MCWRPYAAVGVSFAVDRLAAAAAGSSSCRVDARNGCSEIISSRRRPHGGRCRCGGQCYVSLPSTVWPRVGGMRFLQLSCRRPQWLQRDHQQSSPAPAMAAVIAQLAVDRQGRCQAVATPQLPRRRPQMAAARMISSCRACNGGRVGGRNGGQVGVSFARSTARAAARAAARFQQPSCRSPAMAAATISSRRRCSQWRPRW
jgi:hypothetical protein